MLQVQVLRQDPRKIKERLSIKNFSNVELVDSIISLDDERKKLQQEFESNQSKLNSASKEIGMLIGKGKKEEAEAKKEEVAALKSALLPITEKLSLVEKQLNDELVKLPNLPSELVPPGKTPADNQVVREGGKKPELMPGAVPHWDL